MRLNPGVTLEHADKALGRVESTWGSVRSGPDLYRAYTDAVRETYPMLKQVFASPDVGESMRSAAYWNLLAIVGARPALGVITDPDVAANVSRVTRVQKLALATEVDSQLGALGRIRAELDALKQLADRRGLPVVYDTNMLNHWQQPSDVKWPELFREQSEDVPLVRLVVPLCVIDELDRQKYGQGTLAERAATAIRYLERTLNGSPPGEQVPLREDATLEVWLDSDDRGGDADLAILRCATDLANLRPDTGARVLSDDIGMRVRAQHLGLKVLRLPEDYRKPGTAIGDCRASRV